MLSEKPSFFKGGSGHNFSGTPASTVSSAARPVSLSDMPAREASSTAPKNAKGAGFFDALISVSLFAIFFGLPIFFTGLTFQGIAFEKQMYFYVWLLIGIVAWASKGVVTGEMHIRRTALDIFILLFLVVYGVSALMSVDRWHSFWGFFGDPSRGMISLTALALAYYFIMSHFTMKRFFLMFGGFLASGFLVVVWSILGVSGVSFLPEAIQTYAPLSLIGTVSTLGIFLSVLVPLFITALYLVWKSTSMKPGFRFTFLGFIGLGLLGTLYLMLALYPFLLDTTKSSLSWMVPLGGISFFLVYILAQIVRPPEQLTWVPMFVFVAILAFLMIGSNSLLRATLPVEVSPNQRLSLQVAKESLKENFFLGVGPANYGYAFSQYRPNEYNNGPLYSVRFYQGTGVFFESLTTIGLIGTALLLIVWLSYLSMGMYLLSSDKEKNKYLSLGLWTGSIMFFIAAFTAPLNGTLILIGVLISTLALALLMKESHSEERYYSLSFKASPKYALALAFIFMLVSAGVAFLFVFIGKVYLADIAVGTAARMSAQAPQKESLALMSSAIGKYPQEGRYYTRLGQEQLSLLLDVEVRKSEEDQDKDVNSALYQQAVGNIKEATRRMPNDVLSIETLGLAKENGVPYVTDADAAVLLTDGFDAYKRASELEPTNPLLIIKQGQMKRLLADAKDPKADAVEQSALYEEAKGLFMKAAEKKPNLAAAHYNLALTEARLKNMDGALKSITAALQYDRNNANFKYNQGIFYQVRDKGNDKELAETAFKDILKDNDKLIDVRLSLGLLYESWNKRDQALEQYRKILDFLPTDGNEMIQSTRKQVEKLISTLQSGKSNIASDSSAAEIVQPTTLSPSLPVTPSAEPNASPLTGPTP
ncbi:MAG: hypothetical protein QG606_510 [Patescibacteria group bacterium]|nr:hypothetical protein [Patescibacteria group bacterium]